MAILISRLADKSSAVQMVPETARAQNIRLGIGYMIAATLAFAITHALSKWLVGSYPVGQIMFSRSLTGLVICAAFLLPAHGLAVFATKRANAHIMRGVSQSISQTCSVIAFSLMPLAGAVAINFSAPLFAALVSIVWLKERAGGARWTALLMGFAGVMVVTNPGMDSLTVGAIFALLNAIMLGSVTAAVRGMAATESSNTLLIWQLTIVSILHALLLPLGFIWPTPADMSLFVLCGIANLVGQIFWTKALALAPATAVSPFFYFMLVWTAAIGFFVWDEIPTVAMLAGSSIVVASGLYLLWYESRRPPLKSSA